MAFFKGHTRWSVISLSKQVADLTRELEFERALARKLATDLLAATKVTPAVVQEAIEAAVIQMPDGEFIAPAAYDWDRLARDME